MYMIMAHRAPLNNITSRVPVHNTASRVPVVMYPDPPDLEPDKEGNSGSHFGSQMHCKYLILKGRSTTNI